MSSISPLELQPDLVQRVYDAVLDAICDGRLPPGERITQEALATELGVSRQPVLQAFNRLRREGFLADAGRKGVQVTPLDGSRLEQVYQVRAELDGLAAALAASRPADERQREQAAGRLLIEAGRRTLSGSGLPPDDGVNGGLNGGSDGAPPRPPSPASPAAPAPAAPPAPSPGMLAAPRSAAALARLIGADLEFHRWLYRASGNPLIEPTLALHWQHLRRYMGVVLNRDQARAAIWREHEQIVDAIGAGDAEGARRLAQAHALEASRDLGRRLAGAGAGPQAPPDAITGRPDPTPSPQARRA